ncbi:MAG: porin [Zoogloeaceae bacterium]|nr:porin [Zoogloeaceae bacterium]
MRCILALLAAFSASAQAQTTTGEVQVYGRIDMGFSHRSDPIRFAGVERARKSQNAINSGQSARSFIGFKGTETLDDGLKAFFVLDIGFTADNGAHSDFGNGRLVSERAFLGLSGQWGTLSAGRHVAPRHIFLATLDPFRAGTVGRYRNVNTDRFRFKVEEDHFDNSVVWTSPNWAGLNLTAAFSTTTGLQETPGNKADFKAFSLLPRYTRGALDAGLSYQRFRVKNLAANPGRALEADDIQQWTLGAAYDFGPLKLSGWYDTHKVEGKESAGTNPMRRHDRTRSFGVGLTVPVGKTTLRAAFSQSRATDNNAETGGISRTGVARAWALGASYALSPRTTLYSAYARLNNDHSDLTRSASLGDAATAIFGYSPYDPESRAQGYQHGFQVGIVHSF